MIRKILIEKVAGPDILRAEAKNGTRPKNERDLALLTLLYKELSHGQYAGFVSDVKLVTDSGADTESGLWNLTGEEGVPVGLFTAGKFSDGYACPALSATAAALAKNAKEVKGRLCLGEFYRLNGFDDFYEFDPPEQPGVLGSGKSLFPGTETPAGGASTTRSLPILLRRGRTRPMRSTARCAATRLRATTPVAATRSRKASARRGSTRSSANMPTPNGRRN